MLNIFPRPKFRKHSPSLPVRSSKVSGYLSQPAGTKALFGIKSKGRLCMGVQASAITIPFSVVKLSKAFFILQLISKSKLARRLSRRWDVLPKITPVAIRTQILKSIYRNAIKKLSTMKGSKLLSTTVRGSDWPIDNGIAGPWPPRRHMKTFYGKKKPLNRANISFLMHKRSFSIYRLV